jgi:hypothetical protein
VLYLKLLKIVMVPIQITQLKNVKLWIDIVNMFYVKDLHEHNMKIKWQCNMYCHLRHKVLSNWKTYLQYYIYAYTMYTYKNQKATKQQ